MAWSDTSTYGLWATFCGLLAVVHAGVMMDCNQPANDNRTIYDFSLKNVHQNVTINLSDYRGKVVLIVNVATYCGLTHHYFGMNALQSQYGSQGFVILGFPCNQFLKQEPGANGTEIMNGIKYVRPGGGFVPNFQLFEKIEVNGVNEHILYIYLKSVCPPTATVFNQTRLFYTPIKASDVAWNFEAFLIGYDGKEVSIGREKHD
uniref:Glutathione peroxidase n=1 Tax=Biomphalaria glabrata TaxID=6526 RepID=A0A2C9JW72_BIOGL